MKPVRASLIIVALAGLLLSGCAAAAPKPAPDASTLEGFGDALAVELAWFDNVYAATDIEKGEISERVAGLSVLGGPIVNEAVTRKIADSALSVGAGYEGSLERTTVVVDDWEVLEMNDAWEVIDTGGDTVTVVYAMHYVRELEELGDDRWEQVVEYEVTFDAELANVTAIEIRDAP